MASLYGQRPRIVIEESPIGTFFAKLPETILSFMQLQHQIEFKAKEAEKDRQFKESQLYLRDLMETKRMLQKSIIAANQIAQTKGVEIDLAFSKISDESTTAPGEKTKQDYKAIFEQDIKNLQTELSEVDDSINLANLGALNALQIDTDFSGSIDTNEIAAYQEANPQLLEELGLETLPEEYLAGAQNYLLRPAVRKQQKENKKVFSAASIMKSWGELDPSDERYAHQKRAMAAFNLDPSSDKVTTEILNVMSAEEDLPDFQLYGKTWTSVGSGYASTPEGQKEILEGTIVPYAYQAKPDKYRGMWFRVSDKAGVSTEQKTILTERKDVDKLYTGLQSDLRGTSKSVNAEFLKDLAWDPNKQELPRADTFHQLGPSHRKNLAENFAVWFSQETKEGNDADNDAPSWMSKVFWKNGGWDDVERAVTAVMDHPSFAPLRTNAEAVKAAFDWSGKGNQEDAANAFFMQSLEMFDLTEKHIGRDLDYKFLEGKSKVTDDKELLLLNKINQIRGVNNGK